MLYTIIYCLGVLGFLLWDAYIGFGDKFDKSMMHLSAPPVIFLAIVWFLSLPVMMFISFSDYLFEVKLKRKQRELEKLKKESNV
jgi:hypothetical protein